MNRFQGCVISGLPKGAGCGPDHGTIPRSSCWITFTQFRNDLNSFVKNEQLFTRLDLGERWVLPEDAAFQQPKNEERNALAALYIAAEGLTSDACTSFNLWWGDKIKRHPPQRPSGLPPVPGTAAWPCLGRERNRKDWPAVIDLHRNELHDKLRMKHEAEAARLINACMTVAVRADADLQESNLSTMLSDCYAALKRSQAKIPACAAEDPPQYTDLWTQNNQIAYDKHRGSVAVHDMAIQSLKKHRGRNSEKSNSDLLVKAHNLFELLDQRLVKEGPR
jgi:hypothetical protein